MCPNICFHPSNQLEYLDLSGNSVIANWFFNHQYSVAGLIHIKVLNISNCGVKSVLHNMLLSFPSLQVVDMSRNNIMFYNERSMRLGSNKNIQFLSFAHNLITLVPQNLFSGLVSLKKLDLSHNHIHDFGFNFSGLYSLRKLNVDYNMISYIPEATQKQLIQLAEHIAPRVITVDLSNNQLACLCSSISFLTFMNQNKPTNLVFNNYHQYLCCDRNNSPVLLHKINLGSLKSECLESGVYNIGNRFIYGMYAILVAIPLSLVVIILLHILSANPRLAQRQLQILHWQIYIWCWQIYLEEEFIPQKRQKVKKSKSQNSFNNYDAFFDVFVLYNRCDNHWVHKVLLPKLVDEQGFRLCLHSCNLYQDKVITKQMIKSMKSSEKTLLILSKKFLASEWCFFEMMMAQYLSAKWEDILLVLVEPLPDHMVPNKLSHLLKTRTYVVWTENDIYGQKLFWNKIYYSIPVFRPYISQPSDLVKQAPQPRIQIEESDPSSEAAAREGEQLLVSSRLELSESTFICNLLAHVYGVNCFRYIATY